MSDLLRHDETRQLSTARDLVAGEFPDVPPARVTEVFDAVVAAFEGAPVRTYLPVLAQRQARELLRSGSS